MCGRSDRKSSDVFEVRSVSWSLIAVPERIEMSRKDTPRCESTIDVSAIDCTVTFAIARFCYRLELAYLDYIRIILV